MNNIETAKSSLQFFLNFINIKIQELDNFFEAEGEKKIEDIVKYMNVINDIFKKLSVSMEITLNLLNDVQNNFNNKPGE